MRVLRPGTAAGRAGSPRISPGWWSAVRWCPGLTPAPERLDDDHVSAAAWARRTGIERLFRHGFGAKFSRRAKRENFLFKSDALRLWDCAEYRLVVADVPTCRDLRKICTRASHRRRNVRATKHHDPTTRTGRARDHLCNDDDVARPQKRRPQRLADLDQFLANCSWIRLTRRKRSSS